MGLLGLAALVALPGWAEEKEAKKVDKTAELIKKLGSDSFDEREDATKALDAIGEPALEALKKAAKSDDPEMQKRAEELVKKISKRAETSRLLAPTKVQLKFKDTPVKDALAEFSKKSGYQILAHDPNNKLNDRKVTLETEEISFWEAFDKFCTEAKVVEANPEDLGGGGPIPPNLPQENVPTPRGNAPLPPPQFGGRLQFQVQGGGQAQPGQAPPPQQVQPGQGVPLPAVPVRPGGGVRPIPGPQYPQGSIVVVDGKPVDYPTQYSGAIRFRGLPADPKVFGNPQAGEQMFILEVTPEPKLQWQGMTGMQIEKAIDDLDQKLAQYTPKQEEERPERVAQFDRAVPVPGPGGIRFMPGYNSLRQQIPARLKKGEKEAKSVKEVSGVVSVQVRTPPEPMITVENILKAAGTTVKGDNGGSIKVTDVSKDDDKGILKLSIELDYPQEVQPVGGGFGGGFGGGGVVNPGGPIRIQPAPAPVPVPLPPQQPQQGPNFQVQVQQVQVQVGQAQALPGRVVRPGFAGAEGLTLVDEKGNNLEFTVTGMNIQPGPAGFIRTINLEVKLAKDAPAPAKLVFSATRLASLDIPFTLKEVALKK